MRIRIAVLLLASALSFSAQAQVSENLSSCMQAQRVEQSPDVKKAVELYEDCLQNGSLTAKSAAVTYRNLGSLYRRLGEANKAVESADKALALNPPDPWADYVNRGNAWSTLGDLDKALADYDQAQRLFPTYHQAYFNRGIVLEKQGKISLAKAQFELAYKNGLRTPQMMERHRYHNLATDPATGLAPDVPVESIQDVQRRVRRLAQGNLDRAVCLNRTVVTVDTIVATLMAHLTQSVGMRGLPSLDQLTRAMVTVYPCPFSPLRPELRVATAGDVMGAWMVAQDSVALRFGRLSPSRASRFPLPEIKCIAVGYFEGGERRTVEFGGDNPCPYMAAKDLDPMRRLPQVASWSIDGKGRIFVTRSDVADHIEEWDAYVVTQAFSVNGVAFKVGDLATYLRRDPGNAVNATREFRHLQKLP